MHRYQNNETYIIPSERVNTEEEMIRNFDPKTSGKFGYPEKDYAQMEQRYK